MSYRGNHLIAGAFDGAHIPRRIKIMFKLTIKTCNEAFADDPNEELARLLEHTASRLRDGLEADTLRDANGNTVGTWRFGNVR